MRRIWNTLAVFAFAIATSVLSEAQAQSFTHGNWRGTPLFDKSGGFSRCKMEARYNSGIRLMFDIDPAFSWRMWLEKPSWKLTVGKEIRAKLVVDNGALIPVTAEIVGSDLVMIPLANTTYVVENMKKGNVLEFVVGDLRIPFSLEGTNQAISMLVDCVRAASPKINPPQVAKNNSDFQPLTSGEASVLAANILNSAGARDYKLSPPDPKSYLAIFGFSDGSMGFLGAARGINTKQADEYSADVIGRQSSNCKGTFLSAKEALPSTDGTVIRKLLTTCKSAEETMTIETTILRRTNGFLIELGQVILTPKDGSVSIAPDTGRSTALVDAALKMPDGR